MYKIFVLFQFELLDIGTDPSQTQGVCHMVAAFLFSDIDPVVP